MMTTKKLLVFTLLGLSASLRADSLFDEYCTVEDPLARYPIPETGARLIGTQKGFYTGPKDLSPGTFNINLIDGLAAFEEGSFTMIMAGNWGKYKIRVTPLEDEPAGDNEYNRERNLVNTKGLRIDQLPGVRDKNILMNVNVTEVFSGGEGWLGEVEFASGMMPCRFDVLEVIEERRIPEVHSRQYGPHVKHAFDVYYPEGFQPGKDEPLPFVMNIHGGGWGALDKINRRMGESADSWNERGIALVSINYRYVSEFQEHPEMTVPVAACLLDAARGLQYIRHHADELGLDPDRVNLTGGSAGGATSAWMAMVDDLADPDSPDPIARQSTRVTCSTPHQAQTSIDPKRMREWIPSITYGAHAFFPELPKDREERFQYALDRREEILPYIEDFSAYRQATPDDPPMLLVYGGQPDVIPAKDTGNATHHPQFGAHLHKRLQELGVESYFWAGVGNDSEGRVRADKKRYDWWPGTKNFVVDQFGLAP